MDRKKLASAIYGRLPPAGRTAIEKYWFLVKINEIHACLHSIQAHSRESLHFGGFSPKLNISRARCGQHEATDRKSRSLTFFYPSDSLATAGKSA